MAPTKNGTQKAAEAAARKALAEKKAAEKTAAAGKAAANSPSAEIPYRALAKVPDISCGDLDGETSLVVARRAPLVCGCSSACVWLQKEGL